MTATARGLGLSDRVWALIKAEDWQQLRLHALEAFAQRLTAQGHYGDAAAAALAAVRAFPELGGWRLPDLPGLRLGRHFLDVILAHFLHQDSYLAWRGVLNGTVWWCRGSQPRPLGRPIMSCSTVLLA